MGNLVDWLMVLIVVVSVAAATLLGVVVGATLAWRVGNNRSPITPKPTTNLRKIAVNGEEHAETPTPPRFKL